MGRAGFYTLGRRAGRRGGPPRCQPMRALYLTLPPPTYLILLTTLHMLPFVITITDLHQLPRHAGFALFGLFPSSAITSPKVHTHTYTYTLTWHSLGQLTVAGTKTQFIKDEDAKRESCPQKRCFTCCPILCRHACLFFQVAVVPFGQGVFPTISHPKS